MQHKVRRRLFKNVSAVRRRNMSAIRSKNTKPEKLLRSELFKMGLRYRIHREDLPGKPDIVFSKKKLAIFCDGDFWHGRNWAARKKKGFSVRQAYWVQKIEGNIKRDRKNRRLLKADGWTVVRIWADDLKKDPEKIAANIFALLSS